MRVLVDLSDGRLRLRSRNDRDVGGAFPELAHLATVLTQGRPGASPEGHRDALLDGELVVLRDGVPSFGAIAERWHLEDPRRAAALAARCPAMLVVFDLLRVDGADLTRRPWTQRRGLLEALVAGWPNVLLSPVYDDGEALLAATLEQGLEGVVAKRRVSRYAPGVRGPDWVKLAHKRVQSCLVGGWKWEKTGRKRIGSVFLGVPHRDGLIYAGRAGSGMSGALEAQLRQRLAPLVRPTSPFSPQNPIPRADSAGAVWTEPLVVLDVRYLGVSENGRLRQPVLRGIRDDLDPAAL